MGNARIIEVKLKALTLAPHKAVLDGYELVANLSPQISDSAIDVKAWESLIVGVRLDAATTDWKKFELFAPLYTIFRLSRFADRLDPESTLTIVAWAGLDTKEIRRRAWSQLANEALGWPEKNRLGPDLLSLFSAAPQSVQRLVRRSNQSLDQALADGTKLSPYLLKKSTKPSKPDSLATLLAREDET
jgi:hypothetical protein